MDLHGVGHHLLLCNGKSCIRNGAEAITEAIRRDIHDQSLTDTIHTTKTLCNGQCKYGPIVVLYPLGYWYRGMTPTLGKALVKSIGVQRPYKQPLLYSYARKGFQSELF
ncbi:(2Fe-2S) ferredoxin domain-containing protein [Natribacillus halophilus]|uniref:Thioredoxin-like [2Fe-2S] ferredoxin n=1 Tax=Natribacillus halophilus TaxID=549003 RepID=A0A1G8RGN2_9BACI|nr:(2Fe-2S) ferredoxin domain-containing protein [Natribacillus halophilus]SDJ15540.1 Thioredoxin-like [2Fe-2S] ferredoxin [Natribacillus halophilus]